MTPTGSRLRKGRPTRRRSRIDFIDDQFDFPAFVLRTGDLEGWRSLRVEEIGDQAMTPGVALQLRVGDGVFDEAHQHERTRLALPILGFASDRPENCRQPSDAPAGGERELAVGPNSRLPVPASR